MINFKLALLNPLDLPRPKPKTSKGKIRRHKKKVSRLKSLGMGCPWVSDAVIFRVELVWENKLGEQANFSLHWISVRNP
jgi:hypothetical protein